MATRFPISRRRFVKTGLIFVPTIFSTRLHGSIQLAALEHETYGWMGRVVTNTGHYTSLSVMAVDSALKIARPHFSKILRWNLYCGSDQPACMTPVVNTGNTVDAQAGVSGGWTYSQATGLTGDGSTDYVTTGFVPATHWSSDNSCSMGVYVRTKLTTTDAAMGCTNGANVDYMLVAYSGNNSSGCLHGACATFVDGTNGLGHYMASRSASNSLVLYKNGVAQNTQAIPTGTRVATNGVFIHAFNVNGTASSFSARVFGGYDICTGLTAAEVVEHYNAVQRAQTILGRQV